MYVGLPARTRSVYAMSARAASPDQRHASPGPCTAPRTAAVGGIHDLRQPPHPAFSRYRRAAAADRLNPFDFDLSVTALTVTVRPGSSRPGCDGPANLQVTQSNAAAGSLDRCPRTRRGDLAGAGGDSTTGDDARPGDKPGRLHERRLRALLQRHWDASVSKRSRILVVAAVGVALSVAGVVGAYWSTGSDPGGNGHASAGSLPMAATPTASPASRDATVSWTQSIVLGSRLGQLAGGGYAVTRYAESFPTTPILGGGSCAGTISGASDPLGCTDPSLPTGRWRYTATPTLYNWVGGASARARASSSHPMRPPRWLSRTVAERATPTSTRRTRRASRSTSCSLPRPSLATSSP